MYIGLNVSYGQNKHVFNYFSAMGIYLKILQYKFVDL